MNNYTAVFEISTPRDGLQTLTWTCRAHDEHAAFCKATAWFFGAYGFEALSCKIYANQS